MYAQQIIGNVIGRDVLESYVEKFEKLSKTAVCSLSSIISRNYDKDGRIPFLKSVFGTHHADLLPAFGTQNAIIENLSICFGCSSEMCERLKEVCDTTCEKSGLRIMANDANFSQIEVNRFCNEEITRYLAHNVDIQFDVNKLLNQITGRCSIDSLNEEIRERKKDQGEDIYTVLFRDCKSSSITCITSYSVKRRLCVKGMYEVSIRYHVTTPKYNPRGKEVIAQLVESLRKVFGNSNVTVDTYSSLAAAKYWYGNGFVFKHWVPEQLEFWDWNPWDPLFKYLERGEELKREHYPFGRELFALYLKHADALTMTTEEFRNCYYLKPPYNSFVTVGDSQFLNKNTKSTLGNFFLILTSSNFKNCNLQ